MSRLQLLVPMDGTEFSRNIEPQVQKLFPADRWALRLLHVARVPVDPGAAAYQPATVGPDYRLYMYGYELPGADLHPVYDEERLEDFRRTLERDLQAEVGLFAERGYEVSAAVHFGEPSDAIVAYAEDTGVDLVAMATHSRRGLERLIHGSVARRVLNRLTIPALLLRVDEGGEAAADTESGGEALEADPGARTPDLVLGGSQVRKDDQEVTPAETTPATLSGLAGRGVLTILRGDSGRPVSTKGSWFPDDPDADLAALEHAERHRRGVIYEGRTVGAETAGVDDHVGDHVRREVRLTSVRRYRDYGGQTRTLVSFELADEPDQTDVPDQLTRTEFDALPMERVAELSGLDAPPNPSRNEEADFRERAWKSYKLDIEHRDEWGTARQNTPLPKGE
jgi:nucleotide-binding universal stress UspA family protein